MDGRLWLRAIQRWSLGHSWLYWRKPLLKKINSCFLYEVMCLLKMISFKCMIYSDRTHPHMPLSPPFPLLQVFWFSLPHHMHRWTYMFIYTYVFVCIYNSQLQRVTELCCKLEFVHMYTGGLCIYSYERICTIGLPASGLFHFIGQSPTSFSFLSDRFMVFMADHNSIVERAKL